MLATLLSSFSRGPVQAATTPQATVVVPCPGFAPISRPSSMIMACGDGSVVATDLSWSSWGASAAKASGKLAANDFMPDRALGHFQYFAARFTLTHLRRIDGHSRYLKLTVTYLHKRPYGGEPPWGKQSNTYFLGDHSAPHTRRNIPLSQ
jgi:hypothetical protein